MVEETSDNTEIHRDLRNVRGKGKACRDTSIISFAWKEWVMIFVSLSGHFRICISFGLGTEYDLYASHQVTNNVTCYATF
jgi:hypothetical protein